MAKKTIVTLTDDVDGSEAVETVTFGLDGVQYEIDLSAKNAEALRAAIEEWAGSARRVSGRPAKRQRVSSEVDPAQVRAWATEQGYEVSARGRVSAALVEAYKASR